MSRPNWRRVSERRKLSLLCRASPDWRPGSPRVTLCETTRVPKVHLRRASQKVSRPPDCSSYCSIKPKNILDF